MASSNSSNSKKKQQVGTCIECGSAFEVKRTSRPGKYCSKRCYGKNYSKREGVRKKNCEYMREYNQRESHKKKKKEYSQREDYKARQKEYSKKRSQTTELREWKKEYRSGDKYKKWSRKYERREEVKQRRRRYRTSERGKESSRRVKHKRRVGESKAPTIELSTLIDMREGRCCYCKTKFDNNIHKPNVEHIIPVAKGGTNDPINLDVACARCNHRKNDRDLADFLAEWGLIYKPLSGKVEAEQLELF